LTLLASHGASRAGVGLTCEAGVSIKPGARAPGSREKIFGAREAGDSASLLWAVGRFAGSAPVFDIYPGAGAPGFMLSPAPRARYWMLSAASRTPIR